MKAGVFNQRTADAITEQQLTDAIIELAQINGWMVHHDRPARTSNGWRTAIQGNAGFPDLIMAKDGRVIVAELKTSKGKLSFQQGDWLRAFGFTEHAGYADVRVAVWRPADYLNGTVDEWLAT